MSQVCRIHPAPVPSKEGEVWREALVDGRGIGVIVSSEGRVYRKEGWTTMNGRKWRKYGGCMIKGPHVSVQGQVYTVSTLIAETFLGPKPDPKMHVRSYNGKRGDLKACNLAWGYSRGNTLYDCHGRALERQPEWMERGRDG